MLLNLNTKQKSKFNLCFVIYIYIVSLAFTAGPSIGSCFPSGCTEGDIHNMLNFTMTIVNRTLDLTVACQDPEMPYSNAAIAAM